MLLTLAAVVFVLFIACVNAANLLLARCAVRAREIATRQALGASSLVLAGSVLLEALILAFVSVTASLALSFSCIDVAKSVLPAGLPYVSDIAVNMRVFSVSVAAAVLCAIVFGGGPAWLAARIEPGTVVKSSSELIVGSPQRARLLSALLVADIAFACASLVVTTLVVTSFVIVSTKDLGFDRQNVLILSYRRSLSEIPPAKRAAAAAVLRSEVIGRAKSVAGVIEAAISINAAVPLTGGSVRYNLYIPGIGETSSDELLETNMVTPDYFRALGMALVRGRSFDASDTAGAPPVMLINDVAARRYFSGRDPVGQVVMFRGPTTIIGVLRGVHFDGPEADVRPAMYTPAAQEPFHGDVAFGTLVVRTAGDGRAQASALREAVKPALDREPSRPQFINDHFHQMTAGRRLNAALMTTFGVIAIVIGAIGVFGVTWFAVAKQIPSIGVRMTLGASPKAVMRWVLRETLLRVGIGVAIGLALASIVSNTLESLLFGVEPVNVFIYCGVGVFLAAVASGAALIPALRASRVDPAAALRSA
jgi:predicted permease